MKKLFFGFLFIFFNFQIVSGDIIYSLFPDFLGFLLITAGLFELSEKSTKFSKLRPLAAAMSVFSGAVYALELSGTASELGLGYCALLFVGTCISAYMTYTIILGVHEFEQQCGSYLNSDRLMIGWLLFVIVSMLSYLRAAFPEIRTAAYVCVSGVGIVFLLSFFKTVKLYSAADIANKEKLKP